MRVGCLFSKEKKDSVSSLEIVLQKACWTKAWTLSMYCWNFLFITWLAQQPSLSIVWSIELLCTRTLHKCLSGSAVKLVTHIKISVNKQNSASGDFMFFGHWRWQCTNFSDVFWIECFAFQWRVGDCLCMVISKTWLWVGFPEHWPLGWDVHAPSTLYRLSQQNS